MNRNQKMGGAIAALSLTFAGAPHVQAQTNVPITAQSYTARVDTSSLTQGATYTLDFQLSDGSLHGDGNTSLSLSGFTFDGGSALTPTLNGGATQAPNGTVTLIDNTNGSPSAEYIQPFQAGQFVTFNFNRIMDGTDLGSVPDELAFYVLTGSGNMGSEALPTNDPAGANGALLTVDYPSIKDPSFTYSNYSPQDVTFAPVPAVPEASTTVSLGLLLLLGAGLSAMSARKRKGAA